MLAIKKWSELECWDPYGGRREQTSFRGSSDLQLNAIAHEHVIEEKQTNKKPKIYSLKNCEDYPDIRITYQLEIF